MDQGLSRFCRLFLLLFLLALVPVSPSLAHHPVTLQLRWDHQFQFAGYYAAKWMGYYQEEGLEVEFLKGVERKDGNIIYHNAIDQVRTGVADFGVGSVNILEARNRGIPLTVTATFFQKSPTMVFVRSSAGAKTARDLARLQIRRFVGDSTDIEYRSMLMAQGIHPDSLPPLNYDGSTLDLFRQGRIDGYVGYSLSGIREAQTEKLDMDMLRPGAFGVSFYGDSLFVHQKLVNEDPALVNAFTRASIRGWQYALEHPEEIADRISAEMERTFPREDIREFNRFQAREIIDLSLYPLVQTGHTSLRRWQHMQEFLISTGTIDKSSPRNVDELQDFIFDYTKIERRNQEQLILVISLLFVVVVGVLGFLFVGNVSRRHKETIRLSLLEKNEKYLRSLIQQAGDPILLIDFQGRIYDANRRAETFFGEERDRLLGKNLDAICISPGGRRLMSSLQAIQDNGDDNAILNVRMRNKNNQVLEADVSSSSFTLDRHPVYQLILHDLTERRQIENSLREAKEVAELSSRSKSEFLAAMSHELRTPLNAVLGFSEIIKSELFGPLNNGRYRDYAEDIHRSGAHLLDLVNDILDISAIEKGSFSISETRVNPVAILEASLRMVRHRAQENLIALSSTLPPDLPDLFVDERRLKQILVNLLGNAVKYTGSGGMITVSAWIDDTGFLLWEVRDTGPGMTAEEVQVAMKLFGQVANIHKGITEGTGLGLPLSRELVEAHQGWLEVQSQPGVGTWVRFGFPPSRICAPRSRDHRPAREEEKAILQMS